MFELYLSLSLFSDPFTENNMKIMKFKKFIICIIIILFLCQIY